MTHRTTWVAPRVSPPDSSVLNWLLEEEEPSVRYRTLTELLGRGSDDPEVRRAKAQVAMSKPVTKLFSKMHPDGYWCYVDERTGKALGSGVTYLDYVTTHFNLAFLSELGLDREDPRLSLAADRYLNLQQPDGDFHGHFSCLYTYNLRSFVRMGYKDDPRVRRTMELMLATERPDGGYLCDHHEGKHATRPTKSCIRGSVKALVAFAELPGLWNSSRCRKLVSYFLRRRVYFQTQRQTQPATREITSTIFPFVWRASFLEALYALSVLGYGRAPELADAWALLETKMNDEGRYITDWTPPRSHFKPDKRGRPSKWVTLYAKLALKHRGNSGTSADTVNDY
jgi:hypothetical protein